MIFDTEFLIEVDKEVESEGEEEEEEKLPESVMKHEKPLVKVVKKY